MNDFNFKYRGRKGVLCPKVQVDVLSYEPLHKRIERFLSGDASSLEGVDTTKFEYDEPEKIGADSSVFEPSEIYDDVLNQPLDKLDIEEIYCDNQKVLSDFSKKRKVQKNDSAPNFDSESEGNSSQNVNPKSENKED